MIVTRNNNIFEVKRSKCWHYYTRMLLNNKPVTAWVRTTRFNIRKNFKTIDELTTEEINRLKRGVETIL